jgi:hypothetical protein
MLLKSDVKALKIETKEKCREWQALEHLPSALA